MTTNPRTCNGTRKDGNPCQSTVVRADGYCALHGSSPHLLPTEIGRAGGLRSGEVRREQAKSVRERLREKVEEELEAVWGVYWDAMVATTGEGESDHRARLAAVEGLLAQAYGRPPQQLVGDVDRPVAITVVSAFAQEDDGVDG